MNSWLARRCGKAGREARSRQPLHQVVGIQRGEARHPAHALAAQQAHVDVGAQQDAGVAHEAGQPPDALGPFALGQPAVLHAGAPLPPAHDRNGQEGLEAVGDRHDARARPAAAVGRREGLVQVDVHHVEAHGRRAAPGPGWRSGWRRRSRAVRLRRAPPSAISAIRRSKTPRVEGFVSMMPAVCGPTTLRRASTSTSPSGPVGISTTSQPHMVAVAGLVPWAASGTMIWVRPVVAPGEVIGADHGHAGELALGAGHRRQRHAAHARDGLEHLLQVVQALEEALGMGLGLQRMAVEEARQHGQLVRRRAGCTSSCTNPAGRSACRWRSSAGTAA